MKTDLTPRPIDELETDLIVSTLFEEERPPREITGLIDWRLNGFVSRMILGHTISGRYEETVLIPLQNRLPSRRFLLLGLGKKDQFQLSQARHVAYRLGKVLGQLQTIDVALFFPPAFDEKSKGETQQSVLDGLRQAGLPSGLFVRWLSAPSA